MTNTILVSEVFGPTLQGEGALIGKPTVFVRTGACDYRCSWCDTLYAVLPEYRHEWQPMTPQAILDKVLLLSKGHPILITISGGNPALQPLEPLLDLGHERGFTFALETQGSVAKSWFARLDHLVLSPKPPSSDMETDWQKLAACVEAAGPATQTIIKVVVFDNNDYTYARRVHSAFPQLPMYLQVGSEHPAMHNGAEMNDGLVGNVLTTKFNAADMTTIVNRVEWLLDKVTEDGWHEVTVLPQMHVLLWGNKRGV